MIKTSIACAGSGVGFDKNIKNFNIAKVDDEPWYLHHVKEFSDEFDDQINNVMVSPEVITILKQLPPQSIYDRRRDWLKTHDMFWGGKPEDYIFLPDISHPQYQKYWDAALEGKEPEISVGRGNMKVPKEVVIEMLKEGKSINKIHEFTGVNKITIRSIKDDLLKNS